VRASFFPMGIFDAARGRNAEPKRGGRLQFTGAGLGIKGGIMS
jgi:hypothetical protein